MDELYLEECRARFEYEELMALKSELERRKLAERKEMEELREELASMHTLYQYRTYSVDSSESSSDEGKADEGRVKEGGGRDKEEEVEELTKVLSGLVRENKELEVRQHNVIIYLFAPFGLDRTGSSEFAFLKKFCDSLVPPTVTLTRGLFMVEIIPSHSLS